MAIIMFPFDSNENAPLFYRTELTFHAGNNAVRERFGDKEIPLEQVENICKIVFCAAIILFRETL